MKTSIREVELKTLTETEHNPRQISKKDFETLKKSLKEFPEMQEIREIVVDENMTILGGHQRVKAMMANGQEKATVKIVEGLTDEQKRQFVIKDNIANGDWDWDEIANDWSDMPFDDWGLDVDWAKPKEIVEDAAPEVNESEPAKSELGKVYQLGEHRLMCGDSTDAGSVAVLMNGQKADMVFTDPPYRVETEGGHRDSIGKSLHKQGRSIEFISDFDPKGFLSVLPEQFEKGVMNAYVFCNKDLLPEYLNWAITNKYSYNVLVWKKPNAIPIGDSHRPDIEYLLLFRKNAIWNNALDGVNYSRCLEFGRETGLHPTMKPIGLIANEMRISTNSGSVVLDLFGGSGSTLIACEQIGRKCFMMELDPKYCDVIRKRWVKLTTGSEDNWQELTPKEN